MRMDRRVGCRQTEAVNRKRTSGIRRLSLVIVSGFSG